MRLDSIGMFWEDLPTTRGRNSIARVMPDIPETGWTRPRDFPDLSSARVLSLDTETFDPELLTHGPGWARGKGHIVGASIACEGGYKWYFPIRHEIRPEENMEIEPVLRWLQDTLSNPCQPKVGANLLYDIGWLRQEGISVRGDLVDVQFAEALLDERAKVGLEVLGQKYLGEGKETSLLYQWCADFYGGQANSNQRANIYRAPASLVGPYAEGDADLPLRLAPILYQKMHQEGLLDLFEMECGLIYLLIEMRFAGISVDINKAEEVRDTLLARQKIKQAELDALAGRKVCVNNTGQSLAKAFDSLGIPYGRTAPTKAFPKGQASFTKSFLNDLTHPIGDLIREVRSCEKLRGTFVESYILDSHVNGKVYGQFHPMRGDEGGTRSGRFSSSTPNLQNIPSRDEELAPLVRGLFIPDCGHLQFRRYDYSQIEYRFLAHFAVGPMSDEVRHIYLTNPNTDYHDMTMDLVHRQTGQLLKRKAIKNINFGLIYGMGIEALSAGLGLTKVEGKKLFDAYHKGAPFAKATMEACSKEALETGTITTILMRKSRFDLWEPADWDRNSVALPYEKAILCYGQMRRAYTHKALNRRLQGSAADLMKKAMWRCWREGVFDATGVPRLTVHDELDFSDPGGKEEAFKEMQHILETAIPLRVPVKAECEIGPDWGHVEELKN